MSSIEDEDKQEKEPLEDIHEEKSNNQSDKESSKQVISKQDEEEALEILNKRIKQDKDSINYLHKDIEVYEEFIKYNERD
jgi:hypothetical protein